MKLPVFMRENPALAAFAFLATATSGFGQTFFVSVFGSGIRDSFTLSHSNYGFTYSLSPAIDKKQGIIPKHYNSP